ncbi:MAG: hypothetical protein RL701_3994 [Pseudomonadota bacterium]|jgi:hypothetical protein
MESRESSLHPNEQAASIPNVAHFIWYGRTLPWLHAMSVVTAARAGAFTKLVLHHEPTLDSQMLARLREVPKVELRVVDPARAFANFERSQQLHALYERLTQPAARANLMRAAVLHAEGGVYLDMDVVTLKSFAPLLNDGVFFGAEPVALPSALLEKPSLRGYTRAYALMAVRDVLRRAPAGPHWFRHVARYFTLAANNAIVGALPGHPFMKSVLNGMLDLPEDKQLRRYALGTHLLQRTLRASDSQNLVVHPQAAFYPLGPELSEHWFRLQTRTQPSAVIGPDTYAVHWYASVRTRHWVERMNADFVRKHHGRQLISTLLAPHVEHFAESHGL